MFYRPFLRCTTGSRPQRTLSVLCDPFSETPPTTINDELKLWKDEQAKAEALTAALPPAVANAMINVWAIAVEHGEKVFDQHREEAESQLAQANAQIEALESEKNGQDQRIQGLQADIVRGQTELNSLSEALAGKRTAKDAAIAKSKALEQQIASTKADAEQALITLKSEHRQRIEELQAIIASQESSFRLEINKATERLEGVQKHVMLQVTEAREAQKRAESQLSKANQKNEQLLAEALQIGRQITLLTQTVERAQADFTQAQGDIKKLQSEREGLIQQVATASGKLGAVGDQIESLERRAIGAETRLEEALKRPTAAKKKSEKPHQQDLISR